MSQRKRSSDFAWSGPNYPKADFLSSSRKRLAPQMLYKGGILKAWKKKQAVALQHLFPNTSKTARGLASKADIAWLLYDLKLDDSSNTFKLKQNRIVYTEFQSALKQINDSDSRKDR